MVTFCPFSKGLFVSFLSGSYITSHATRCYLFSAPGNILKWYTNLLFKYLHLKCYFVTLLPRPFCNNTKNGGINCKSMENQSYIKLVSKTIREKVVHDDNDNNNNNNNRDETSVPSHFTLHFTNCNVIQWPIVTCVQVLTVKCKMQWILVFWEYNMVLLI